VIVRSRRTALWAVLVTALALVVAACGGSDNKSSGGGGGNAKPTQQQEASAQKQIDINEKPADQVK